MVAVIRGKLKRYRYNPLGLGRNYFLLINFASLQELAKNKNKKDSNRMNSSYIKTGYDTEKKEKNMETSGQQLAPDEAAKKQSSVP